MKKNSKINKAARKSTKQRKRKHNKRRSHVQCTKQPDSIFDGVKSKDELDQIIADLQQSGRKFLVSLTTIFATKNWEELGYVNAKSFLKTNVPHINYHTAMSWFRSNEIITRLVGADFIGVYSMNAMRVFAPLDSDQQTALWEALTKEWKQENQTEEPIDAAWLTRTKVLEMKSFLFPSTKEHDVAADNVQRPNVLASHPSKEDEYDDEEDFDDSDVHDSKNSPSNTNDEDSTESEVESDQDDDAFDINKPEENEKRLRRAKRFKRHLEQYDGSETFASYIISWVVREYHEKHPSLEKLIVKAVQAELHQLKEQKNKAQEVDNEA